MLQVLTLYQIRSNFWSDGVDPIILGPGRLEEAHTPEESVNFAQVLKAAEICEFREECVVGE